MTPVAAHPTALKYTGRRSFPMTFGLLAISITLELPDCFGRVKSEKLLWRPPTFVSSTPAATSDSVLNRHQLIQQFLSSQL